MASASVSRRPLNRRPPSQLPPIASPFARMANKSGSSGTKRTRSPDPSHDAQLLNAKRARATAPLSPSITPAPQDDDPKSRERRRAERESQREEFRIKYTRAFPTFSFYIHWDVSDGDEAAKDRLVARLERMGSHIEDFFSKDAVTHFITNQSIPSEDLLHNNKENLTASGSRTVSLLKSPIRLRGRTAEDLPVTNEDKLLLKAVEWKMKIWTVAKLESVLDRCQSPASPAASRTAPPPQQNLSKLLEAEKIHGTTERDPTQKQFGHSYFSKGSYFVLVEDLNEELATIHATEYPIKKGRDGKESGAWPVLYCHPRARGPFIEYDKNEERRAERTEKAERAREQERQRRKEKLREQEIRRKLQEQQAEAKRTGDLRRSVSMVNLHRRFSHGEEGGDLIDLDAEDEESANASGYLASGQYVAASGNSVSITSNTGTTSTSGRAGRNTQLSAALRGRLQQQVVTSRKATGDKGKEREKDKDRGNMGPPAAIPERKFLKKSKSTNTMKLPRREEGAKPGYCECCRLKFEDFQNHIATKKHRKFATNDAHFLQLDYVLSRMRRQTHEEVAQTKEQSASRHRKLNAEHSPTRSEEGDLDVDQDGRFSSSGEVSDYLPQPGRPPHGSAWDEDIDLDAEGEDEEL